MRIKNYNRFILENIKVGDRYKYVDYFQSIIDDYEYEPVDITSDGQKALYIDIKNCYNSKDLASEICTRLEYISDNLRLENLFMIVKLVKSIFKLYVRFIIVVSNRKFLDGFVNKDIGYRYVGESLNNNLKYYTNIDNFVDGVSEPYYNIPFSLGENEICITGFNDNTPEDKYVLCLSDAYVYEYITDEMIDDVIDTDLSNIDINKDWTNYISGFETAYCNRDMHVRRIAKLILSLRNNEPLVPISMFFDERAYTMDIKNYIQDGNHRIRALQYLGYDGYTAYIYGGHSEFLIKYIENEG